MEIASERADEMFKKVKVGTGAWKGSANEVMDRVRMADGASAMAWRAASKLKDYADALGVSLIFV